MPNAQGARRLCGLRVVAAVPFTLYLLYHELARGLGLARCLALLGLNILHGPVV